MMSERMVAGWACLVIVFAFAWGSVGCGDSNDDTTSPQNERPQIAAIFPGSTADADYNFLGYVALNTAAAHHKILSVHAEQVAVGDCDAVARQFIDDGYTIVFTHGSQFLASTVALAEAFPGVTFIAESDVVADAPPSNLWTIVRNFHVGYYAIGAIAGRQSTTGKIGYIGGITLPFSYAEVHAAKQALEDLELAVTVIPVWTGDFNDQDSAKTEAEALISKGVDFIMGSVNLGMMGVFDAVKNATGTVHVSAKYTDKLAFAPDNFVTSVLYDFAAPLTEIVESIMTGQHGGSYNLGFHSGVELKMPLANSSSEIESEVQAIITQLQNGTLVVEQNTSAIE